MSRLLRALLAVLTLVSGVLTLSTAAPVAADQGGGNPVLRLSATQADAGRVTDITVTGTDYLVPPHAEGTEVFGGVYVFFGWVANGTRFGPSIRNSSNNDGTFGASYAYPGDGGDPGTRDPGTGTMRLISFTSGGESGTATDFHMDPHGNWTTSLRIYGSTFSVINPATGESRTYDCQQVQCGVFTMGAHGKASATNERFIPLSFTGKATPTTTAPITKQQPVAPPTTLRSNGVPGSAPGGATEPGVAAGADPSRPGSVGGPDASIVDDPEGLAASSAVDGEDGAPSSAQSGSGSEADIETAAIGVRSVRSPGGTSGSLVVIGLVAVAAVGAGTGALTVRRRRRRQIQTEIPAN